MCSLHYKRWYRRGDPNYLPPRPEDRPCKVDGCERNLKPPSGFGMCGMHYKRWKKYGDPNYRPERTRKAGNSPCSIEGCSGKVFGRDWCSKHYTRWRRYGDPTHRLKGEIVNGRRICPDCGLDKPLSEWGKSYCRECVTERMRKHRLKSPPPLKRNMAWVCDVCSAPFMGNKKWRRYCSPECAEANKNRANWPHLNARRARLRDAFVESFDRFEIFERDGWVCGVCNDPVDPEVSWPDPRSASLDHVIPISRGGTHSRDNAQCAHLHCNVVKATQIPT